VVPSPTESYGEPPGLPFQPRTSTWRSPPTASISRCPPPGATDSSGSARSSLASIARRNKRDRRTKGEPRRERIRDRLASDQRPQDRERAAVAYDRELACVRERLHGPPEGDHSQRHIVDALAEAGRRGVDAVFPGPGRSRILHP